MTPWSSSAELRDGLVHLTVLHTTDAGPARMFAPVLELDLSEAHAIILFGELGLALQGISDARVADVVVPFPGGRS